MKTNTQKVSHTVYLPADLLAAVKAESQKQRRSVNFILVEAVENWHRDTQEPETPK
ncbi:MAG: hypothetical protein PHV11_08300 [Candidatus Bipolaricaulis sp.]|jgi:hypothetical protein|nr:hypothetical protein [Candidatus Bipolaricaulis sp.]